ncbi:MAG: carbohydrate binding domain-containing protein [Defluviitaleaceae bacterium]|nr:carbohydrate binding domain-containing protein [Defluviitaleaceae bacterium]
MKRFWFVLVLLGFVGCGWRENAAEERVEAVEPTTVVEAVAPTPAVEETPTPAAEDASGQLVFATSFEESYDGIEAVGGIVERSTVYVRSGEYSVVVAARSEPWHGLALDVTEMATPGGSYMFSVWVRNPGHWRTGFQLMIIVDGQASVMYGSEAAIVLNPDLWTNLVGYFEMPAAAENVKLAVQTQDDAHQVFFVDDVSLYSQAAHISG